MALRGADRRRLQIQLLKPPLSRELGMVVRQDKPLTRAMQGLITAILASAAKPPKQASA